MKESFKKLVFHSSKDRILWQQSLYAIWRYPLWVCCPKCQKCLVPPFVGKCNVLFYLLFCISDVGFLLVLAASSLFFICTILFCTLQLQLRRSLRKTLNELPQIRVLYAMITKVMMTIMMNAMLMLIARLETTSAEQQPKQSREECTGRIGDHRRIRS